MSNRCRVLSQTEAQAILREARAAFSPQVARRNLCLLVCQLRTGYRIAELLSLSLADVVEGGRIVDYVRVAARHMKGRRRYARVAVDEAALAEIRRCFPEFNPATDEVVVRRLTDRPRARSREVPLHPEARKAIAAWVRDLAEQGYQTGDVPLFLSRVRARDGSMKAINRGQAWRIVAALKRLCGLVGTVGTHSMRKAFAQGLFEYFGDLYKGNDAKALLQVQQALGHANVNETVRYLEMGGDDLRRGIVRS